MQMSTISNASFAGRLYKFEMLRNTYYPLFTIWRKGWKYATVAFRNSAASFFVVLQKKTTHKYYIIFHKKNKNNNKQTNKPSALYRAHGVLTRVHRLWKTFSWRTDIRKNQNDILVNALAILLRQYCDYVWYITAPTYLNCKWRCKKLNCAATEITLRFYCALIRTQSHDLYFEHANNTVRQLSVWI